MNAVLDFKSVKQPDVLPAICIDIETCFADQETIERELALWKAPSNWKAETIEIKRPEQEEKIRSKSALLDDAPIATIGVADANGEVVVFHWLDIDEGFQDGFFSQKSQDEKEMLMQFRDWANTCTDAETTVVGFNLNFDLAHLRIAYTRHNLKLPDFLIPRSGNQIADVQYLFSKYFTSKDNPFIGLDEVIQRLGIAPEGKQMSGADVPIAIEEGRHLEVITYNAIDVLITMRSYLICTGQSGE